MHPDLGFLCDSMEYTVHLSQVQGHCLFLSWFSFSGVLWSLSNSGSLSLALWLPDTCPLWVSVSPSLWVFFPSWGFFLFLSLGLYPSPALCPPPLGFYPPIMSEQSTVSPPFPFPCGSDLHVWKENSMGRQRRGLNGKTKQVWGKRKGHLHLPSSPRSLLCDQLNLQIQNLALPLIGMTLGKPVQLVS